MSTFTNRLVHETSPYLLQHAHNPVDWYPWGDEALNKAREENKPILVSIGYAACHWCHVMERESFEDEATAALMNEYFINIKIDREERPDLDHIYMDAVQAMTGSGGWPLNVFLTPDKKPFYGGTYFPPRRAFNRASWQETLQGIINAFKERREEIDSQAQNMVAHLQQANSFGMHQPGTQPSILAKEKMDEAVENILKNADTEWGGFGNAPKFPQTFTIRFLLRYYYVNKDNPTKLEDDLAARALRQALLSLDKMIDGGINDQAGGGFARYATDREWLIPHFEKMLYDNALLVAILSEALQLTGLPRYKKAIEETLVFIDREMMNEDYGFFSALDADSEGEEGKYYVWDYTEVTGLLGDKAALFCEYYDISPGGNWEGKNILQVREPAAAFASRYGLEVDVLEELLADGRKKLLTQRSKRIRPLLDDKIILGWNALMNTAFSKAYAATGIDRYKDIAIKNMQFMLATFSDSAGKLYHTSKNGQAKYPAFLDDQAFLIQALLQLYEATADLQWLIEAGKVQENVLVLYGEEAGDFFYFTPEGQEDVIVRKKEVYDGAVPAGNSVMATNLYKLSFLLDRPAWRERAEAMVNSLGNAIVKYPVSFGNWACLALEAVAGTQEIAVLGNYYTMYKELLFHYWPHAVIMASATGNQEFALLKEREIGQGTSIYLCKNFACRQPVSTVSELMSLIHNRWTNN